MTSNLVVAGSNPAGGTGRGLFSRLRGEMDFGQAISAGFSKYVNSAIGPAGPNSGIGLFTNILGIVAFVIDLMLKTQLAIAVWLVLLPTYIPTLAIGVRRLHDVDRGGWWILISIIPLIGVIVLLVWWTTKGTDGPNQFGPDPLAANPFPNQQFGAAA
jgi:hypothetical protein